MPLQTKLPKVGTTIFTVMSQMAMKYQAVNLGQGFPDFPVPEFLVDALSRAMRDGTFPHALARMFAQGVGNFVSHDHGDLIVGEVQLVQNAVKESDLAPRHTKRIDLV